jgi:hypothetical protein
LPCSGKSPSACLCLPLHDVLYEIVEALTAVVKRHSCMVYVLEKDDLVLRASKNPHPEVVERLKIFEIENVGLSDQLETRKLVERAKGILQRELTINEEESYQMLQRESQQRRKSMKEVAEAIILAENLMRR